MRRPADDAYAPIQSQIVLAPLPAAEAWSAAAATPLASAEFVLSSATNPFPTPANPFPTPKNPIPTPANPFPPPKNPIPTPADPFPTPKNPIPTPTYPFPTPTYPFPTPTYPFPTPANPFPPVRNPFPTPTNPFGSAPPVPTGPSGPPGAANLPLTFAQLDQSDVAVNGPQARASGLSGTGIRIGIISDSFNVLGGAAPEEAAGFLPASGVTVLLEGPAGSTDEGRAMAELVHATAPGAQLYFYSGEYSAASFGAGVAALHAAGCQIIVDDLSYFDEPMFQNAGPIDTAISAAVASGVDYFSAAGNDDSAAYQAAVSPQFVDIAGLGDVWAQTFAGGATTQSVTVQAFAQEVLTLEWNAPYNGDNTDTIAVQVLQGSTLVATSEQDGTAPVVEVALPVAAVDTTYNIAIEYSSGSGQPGVVKYELYGDHAIINNPQGGEPTGAVAGHQMLPGVNAVGAVNVGNTPSEGGTLAVEPFSDSGGSEFLLAPDGAPLPAPIPSAAPELLAPDGADTSVFQPFLGTSAAAPVAAATAALMLQADPALGNADITTLLEDSAIPVASADDAAGAGFIQANLATQFASTRVISGSPQTVIRGISAACTIVSGAGSHYLVAGSGATVLESQGNDTVQAGAGTDTVDLTGAAAVVYGSTGPLLVRTLGGNDTVVGGTGALTVLGGAGGGVIFGSTAGGNDLVAGAQPTTIRSVGGGDYLVGTGNGDQLYASNLGHETLVGGSGTELLVGGDSGMDVFDAGPGSPLIAPEGSTAVVTFGTGGSTVQGGTAAELLQAIDGQGGGFDVVNGFNPALDMLMLTGFGVAPEEAAVADQFDNGGNAWLKLPDGTVIAFVGLANLSAANVTYG